MRLALEVARSSPPPPLPSLCTVRQTRAFTNPRCQHTRLARPPLQVLRNDSRGTAVLLRDILYDADTGGLKPTRLGALLNAALGWVRPVTLDLKQRARSQEPATHDQ